MFGFKLPIFHGAPYCFYVAHSVSDCYLHNSHTQLLAPITTADGIYWQVRVSSQAAIRQLLSNLKRFSRFYPEFQDLELYGMMASPRMTEHDERWAFRNGIYPLAVANDLYTLKVPEGFEAKNYGSLLPSSPAGVYRDLPGRWIEYR